MKMYNFGMKLRTSIIYPFVLIFDFVIVYLIIYPLIMLEDNEVKNAFTEMYGTTKRFFVTTWNWCEVMIIEINQDMKEIWPFYFGILVVALLPITIALICCLC